MAKCITSYGDRVAVRSFCQQTKCSTNEETLKKRLRDIIGTRKMRSKTIGQLSGTSAVLQKQGDGLARHRNTAAEKTSKEDWNWMASFWPEWIPSSEDQKWRRNETCNCGKNINCCSDFGNGKGTFFPRRALNERASRYASSKTVGLPLSCSCKTSRKRKKLFLTVLKSYISS